MTEFLWIIDAVVIKMVLSGQQKFPAFCIPGLFATEHLNAKYFIKVNSSALFLK